jgi:hypothetical protein
LFKQLEKELQQGTRGDQAVGRVLGPARRARQARRAGSSLTILQQGRVVQRMV